ncbi:MAG TPA: redoxin domain-containing protein, partial [Candidatus Nitrosocosmicus sp.]|nr:redoxin domain-containing protein [Candidatus Nitrosocosmicus sp.]
MSSDQKNNFNSKTASKNTNVGDKAPDFNLLDTNQEVHSLSNNKEGLTILAFFPAAGSPVCTVEMCNFRDTLSSLKKE